MRFPLSVSGQTALVDDVVDAATPIGAGRRFAFLSAQSGAGTSGVAALTARALARSRPGRVLLADVKPGQATERLHPKPLSAEERSARGTPVSFPEHVGWTGNLHTVSAVAPRLAPGAPLPTALALWQAQVAPLARHTDLLLSDFGASGDAGVLESWARTGQAAAVVAPAGRVSAEGGLSLALGLRHLEQPLAACLVIVDPAGRWRRWAREMSESTGVPTVSLPWPDAEVPRAALGGRRPRAGAARPSTSASHTAATAVAAALMRLSTPGGHA